MHERSSNLCVCVTPSLNVVWVPLMSKRVSLRSNGNLKGHQC
jgi:hypothetical protein